MQIQLHIGLEKTGTTSIQKFLSTNRRTMRKSKILFPRSPGLMNQTKLAAYAVHRERNDKVRQRHVGDESSAQFDADFPAQFEEELAGTRCTRVVMSNEHCSSRLKTTDEIERLRALLVANGEVTRVLLYLRRQDELMISQYSTTVKMGAGRRFEPPSAVATHNRYDFAAMIEKWEAVFGVGVVVPRLFSRADFHGGDLLLDFCDAMDIPTEGLQFEIRPRNISLSAEGLEMLRLINDHTGRLSQDVRSNPKLVRWIAGQTPGPNFSLGAADRAPLIAQFEAGNEAVRRRFFADRTGPLFDPVDPATPEVPMPDIPEARLQDFIARLPEVDAMPGKREAYADD